jgi:glycosyltransferase involved in cell wall biosynthesis
MQVIISSGGLSYGYDWAHGVQQAGHLKRVITTLDYRRKGRLDPAKVRRVLLPELLGHALWRLPGANSLYFAYLIRDNLYDWLARRHVDGGDVFHVFNHFGLYSMRRARQLGMRTLVERDSAHPVVQDRLLRDEYERYGLRLPGANRMLIGKHVREYEEADMIIVPSGFVWRTMVAQGVPEAKLRQVPLGFAPERFTPAPGGKPDDTFRIVFVGAISLQKGVQYLLEAFRRLSLPDAELVLVGGIFPDSRAFLPRYAGLYRHVGYVPQEQLLELYNAASVFVLPSLQDGFGMVVYEAGACGVPAIVSENVGATIRDGQDGFVVPIRDPDALADRLLRLYRDEDLRREMGRSARSYAHRFTWEASLRQLLACYEELAHSHSGGR